MTVYTNIPKPVGANYTNLNAQGREQYDQADLSYDDSSTYYDGVNQLAYTNVAKPFNSGGNITMGMTTGLLIPFTYSTNHSLASDPYTYIQKPS